MLINLLYKIVDEISNCVDVKKCFNEPQTNDLLFDVDENNFAFYRSLKCLKCNVSELKIIFFFTFF